MHRLRLIVFLLTGIWFGLFCRIDKVNKKNHSKQQIEKIYKLNSFEFNYCVRPKLKTFL